MRTNSAKRERRILPRLTGHMKVSLRQRGRIARTNTTMVDFNRFGIALLTRDPLEKTKPVFLTLERDDLYLENVVGVVHNCIAQGEGYRCGIQFRTRSTLQFDKNLVEDRLLQLELALAGGGEQASAAQ